jgi:hypothetical protein
MTEAAIPARSAPNAIPAWPALNAIATGTLKGSGGLWFLTALVGQWIFAAYILGFYVASAAQGDLAAWNDVLPHGYAPGETSGNIAVIGHMFVAAIITIGGPLQLLPQVRARFPTFHRWNGRIYILTAFTMALSGLYLLTADRTVAGDIGQHLGLGLNALLIMVFAAAAVRFAIARRFDIHRRWAMRLFLAVSGVWFFRVGLMLSFAVFQGPFGFDPESFTGPFLTGLAFAQYLLPLTVLELYFHARDRAGPAGKFAMATGLLVLTLAMGAGIAMAAMFMWLPRIM